MRLAALLEEALVPPDLVVVAPPVLADFALARTVVLLVPDVERLADLVVPEDSALVAFFAVPEDLAVLDFAAPVLEAVLLGAVALAPVLLVVAVLLAEDLVAEPELAFLVAVLPAVFLAVVLPAAFLVPEAADFVELALAVEADLVFAPAEAVLLAAALVPVAFLAAVLVLVVVELAFFVPDLAVELLEAFLVPVRSSAAFSTFRTTLFTTLVTASGTMLVEVLLVDAIF